MAERSPSFLRIRETRRVAVLRKPLIGHAVIGDTVPIRVNRDFIPPRNPYSPLPNYRNPPGTMPLEWYWSDTEHIWTDEEAVYVSLIALEFQAAGAFPTVASPYLTAKRRS